MRVCMCDSCSKALTGHLRRRFCSETCRDRMVRRRYRLRSRMARRRKPILMTLEYEPWGGF